MYALFCPTPLQVGGCLSQIFFLLFLFYLIFFEPWSNWKCFKVSVHKCGATQLHIIQSEASCGKLQSQLGIIYGCFCLEKMTRINLKSSLSMLNMNKFWSCLETFCVHQVHEILFPTTGGAKGFSFQLAAAVTNPVVTKCWFFLVYLYSQHMWWEKSLFSWSWSVNLRTAYQLS